MTKIDGVAKVFRTEGAGLAKLLGSLEAELMDFLWANDGYRTAREVHSGSGVDVKYITVVTVLNNLTEKSLLDRDRRGNVLVFRPAIAREEFLASASEGVVRGLVDLSPRIAVNSFIGVLDSLAPEDLLELREELRRKAEEESNE